VPRVYLAGPPFADEYRRRAADLAHETGWEPVDPMRRDFRGATEGHEQEIVEGDLADIDSCDVVLAAFTAPDEGTAMEAWYAHAKQIPVVVYTAGTPPHPWTVYVAHSVHATLEDAIAALAADGP
jgi:nucleoside 2-deoxyribosyltransferase